MRETMQHICSLEYIRRLYEATNLDGRDTGTVRESFAQLPESNRSRRYVLNNLMACVAGTSTWCSVPWDCFHSLLVRLLECDFPFGLIVRNGLQPCYQTVDGSHILGVWACRNGCSAYVFLAESVAAQTVAFLSFLRLWSRCLLHRSG